MSSDCPEEEDQPGEPEPLSDLEERFILQHNLRPGVPTVRLPRHILPRSASDQAVSQPTISRQPSRGPPPHPPRPASMTPGLPWTGGFPQDSSAQSSPGWQPAGFQPWLSEVDKLRLSEVGGPGGPASPHLTFPFMAGPSHSSHPAGAFSRPGFSTQTPREFLQRPERIQPGFNRPLGPPGPAQTEIRHVTPEPGEVTIEKCEPWTPAPPTPTSPPPRQSPSRPSPPARRMRLRDILTSAVRSALGNQELDQEADRFNTEIGATFMNALGPVVKKEK